MDKRDMFRFYDILQCFMDDERLAAFAIIELRQCDHTPEQVYRQLLNCNYTAWVDQLEEIADNTRFDVLRNWCEAKQLALDMSRDLFWSPGDDKIIEYNGWKLCCKGEYDVENIQ